jgi:hypothetical protein
MSDAPAAQVTENGVPPVAQENAIQETGFKVLSFFSPPLLNLISTRSLLEILRIPPRMKG